MPTTWVVEVHYEEESPAVYGPYTQRQARNLQERIRTEVGAVTDEHGETHHPHGVRSAWAVPRVRYGPQLTPAEIESARAAARGYRTPLSAALALGEDQG
jgi:hypothetical protein